MNLKQQKGGRRRNNTKLCRQQMNYHAFPSIIASKPFESARTCSNHQIATPHGAANPIVAHHAIPFVAPHLFLVQYSYGDATPPPRYIFLFINLEMYCYVYIYVGLKKEKREYIFWIYKGEQYERKGVWERTWEKRVCVKKLKTYFII